MINDKLQEPRLSRLAVTSLSVAGILLLAAPMLLVLALPAGLLSLGLAAAARHHTRRHQLGGQRYVNIAAILGLIQTVFGLFVLVVATVVSGPPWTWF